MKDPVKLLLSEIRESLNLENLEGEKLIAVSQEVDEIEKRMLETNKKRFDGYTEVFNKFLKNKDLLGYVSDLSLNMLYRMGETLVFNQSLLEEKIKKDLDEIDIFYEEVDKALKRGLKDKEKVIEAKKFLIKSLTRREMAFVKLLLKKYGEIIYNNDLTSNLKVRDYSILKIDKKQFTDKIRYYHDVESDFTEALRISFDLGLGRQRYEVGMGRVNIKLIRNLLEIVRRMSRTIKENEFKTLSVGYYRISLLCRNGYFLSIENMDQYDEHGGSFGVAVNVFVDSSITSLEFMNKYEIDCFYYDQLKRYYDLDRVLESWHDHNYTNEFPKTPDFNWIQD